MNKIQELIYFILLAKGQTDDYFKGLSMIHIVKYLYLADIAYFERKGEKYTNINWRFHNFGPWSTSAYKAIEDSTKHYNIDEKYFHNPQYGERKIYYAHDKWKYNEFRKKIPPFLRNKLEKYIEEYGNDTEELLHYVYKTQPMLHASPEEELNFNLISPKRNVNNNTVKSSNTKIKKNIKKALIEKIGKRKHKEIERVKFEPVYDEVYYKGIQWLENISEEPCDFKGSARIDKRIFKSESRHDPELS